MYRTVRNPDNPKGDFIVREKYPRIVLQLHDITHMDQRQEVEFKKSLVAYSTTRANGRDMLLAVHAIDPQNAHAFDQHENPGQLLADLLLEAADYVNDKITIANN